MATTRSKDRTPRRAFTLVEMLVVVVIVLIVAAAVIPALVSMFSNREMSEAARMLQAALTGARDLAIRNNAPAGIRLLPDALLTDPPLGSSGQGTNTLAYSRIQALELAPDYNSGRVSIGPMVQAGAGTFQIPYPGTKGGFYPYPEQTTTGAPWQCLMIEESPYKGGYVVGSLLQPNEPTSWFWNIRIGDKIRLNDAGASYTVVGPCTINPITSPGQNPELFVNAGLPGTASPLVRSYYTAAGDTTPAATQAVEFLFLVNGIDDQGPPYDSTTLAPSSPNGYPDDGFDGFDNNYDGIVDEVPSGTYTSVEWEVEKWLGAAGSAWIYDALSTKVPDFVASKFSPSPGWVKDQSANTLHDLPYSIVRQPVPNEAARETVLPGGVVIDATTWNTTKERSRLPINNYSLFCDILVNPTGQVVPTTIYSTPTGQLASQESFYHFWLSQRTDVVQPIPATGTALPAGVVYRLPMPQGTTGYPAAADKNLPVRFTKDSMMLVTLYPRSGMIVNNTVDQAVEIDTTNAIFSSGFLGSNINQPFFDAQQGFNAPK